MAIFTGRQLCRSLVFNKVVDLQACNFIEKWLPHRCFPVSITKFLRTPILKNNCEWLLPNFRKVLLRTYSCELFTSLSFRLTVFSSYLSKRNFWWNKNWSRSVWRLKPQLRKRETTALGINLMQYQIKSWKYFFARWYHNFRKFQH